MGERGEADGLEQAARAASRQFVDAIRDGDAAAAVARYTEDAWLLAPSAAVIEGRAGIESFWQAGLEAGIRAVELEPDRIDRLGAIAVEIGHYSMHLDRPGGSAVVDRGSYVLVHEPAPDGGWSWVLEAFTPEGSPQIASAAVLGIGGEVGDGA